MKASTLANNQVVISAGNKDVFLSYNSTIAEVKNGTVTLDPNYWDYSRTTLKYLKIFLGVSFSKKEIQDRIDSKEYKTRDLNKGND